MNVSPRLAISHDVNGITPDPISVFLEDRKSLSLGLEFSYLLRWQAGVSYNQYWGGAGTTNLLSDRDFMSFYINYSF